MKLHASKTIALRRPEPEERYAATVKGLDSRLLRYFLAVVECKSFTLAAEKLHFTQPALSKSIQKLEERLGVKLLDRHKNQVEPTRFGQILANRAKLVELELAHAVSEIQSLKGGHLGTVSVGVGPTFVHHLPKAILALQQRRPNVHVRAVVGPMDAMVSGLLSGDLDVVCTVMEFPVYPDIHTEPLFNDQLSLLARVGHPLVSGGSIEPHQLLDYPWITFAKDFVGASRMNSYFAANHVPPPTAAVSVSSLEIMLAMVRQSDYLGYVPASLLPSARAMQIAEVPLKSPFWLVRFGMAYRRTTQPTPIIDEMIDSLRSTFASLPIK